MAVQSERKYTQVASGKDNIYFTRIFKKKATTTQKNFQQKKPKTHKPILLLQKTLTTQNTPQYQTVVQFSFFPKQIKGGIAALVN